jgi:tetraacyldisaccharide 4'-kinase
VGNLTAGGTGKTPAVAFLVRGLAKRGVRPAIVLRGYGAPQPGELNDEGLELAREFPDVPVVANPDRFAGAAEAVRRGANVVVLDDGFQHWALARDFDLVLLNATDPFGGGHHLPWGYLREAPAALARAHAVLITHSDHATQQQLAAARDAVKKIAPNAFLCTARHVVAGVRALSRPTASSDLEALRGRRVFAACGLARPEHFHATLKDLGLDIVQHREFSDHHPFSVTDIQACASAARSAGAEAVVITEKDASKWGNLAGKGMRVPVWVLRITFRILDDEDGFWQVLEPALKEKPS